METEQDPDLETALMKLEDATASLAGAIKCDPAEAARRMERRRRAVSWFSGAQLDPSALSRMKAAFRAGEVIRSQILQIRAETSTALCLAGRLPMAPSPLFARDEIDLLG